MILFMSIYSDPWTEITETQNGQRVGLSERGETNDQVCIYIENASAIQTILYVSASALLDWIQDIAVTDCSILSLGLLAIYINK